MSLRLALLLSLVLHAALILAPGRRESRVRPSSPAVDARLLPPSAMPAEPVSTEPEPIATPARPPDPAPDALRGRALARAQSALSKHLYYPPQAVAQGLEGDVVLLLVLGDGGRLVSADIARGSGHALLDAAALDAARHMGALPGNPRQVLFPVSFRLR